MIGRAVKLPVTRKLADLQGEGRRGHAGGLQAVTV